MREGWRIEKFGGICDLKKGRKPRLTNTKEPNVNPYLVARYLRGAEPTDFAFIADKNSISVTADEIIIICDGSNSGETFIGFDGILSSTMAKIVHGNNIETKFIIYFLELMFEKFNSSKTGSAIPHLDLNALRNQELPVPPLPDQRRIVAILNEAFEGIATAKTIAAKNLQNAREIFESHLNAVFSQRGEGWVEKRLDEVGKTQTGSTPKASEPENLGKHIPFVKPGDFKPDGSITYDNEGLSQNGAAKARLVMAPSAIMVCIGATIGKSAYANRIIATNQQINSLTPATGISAKMVYYQMITVDFQRRVHENAGQATLPIINKSKWSSLSIFIPPTVDEQNHIVARLDNLHEETQRLESLYQKKLIALDELKQSLLHQAFNGNL